MNGAAVAPLTVNTPVETAGMDTRAFLRKIWPAQGYYVVARLIDGKFRHTVCATIEEAEMYVRLFDQQGVAVYHACAVLRERSIEKEKNGKKYDAIRVQENVRAVKCFWADLDIAPDDPKKFESRDAALNALADFCISTGLPAPLVTSSGAGWHIYWPLSEEVDPDTWKLTAVALKALFIACKFNASPERTADMASVLRPVGSTHRKDPANPRPVYLSDDAEPVSYADFHQRVTAALLQLGVKPPEIRPPRDSTSNPNAAFAIEQEFRPFSANKVADLCQQARAMRDKHGCIPEPHWYSMICLLIYSQEGDEIVHSWSNGYQGYSRAETDEKIAHARADTTAPTLCERFEDRNPGGCDGCLFKGKINTPASLGVATSQLPTVPTAETAADPIPPALNRGENATTAPLKETVLSQAKQPRSETPAPIATGDFSAMSDAEALAQVMHAPTEDNVARLFEREGAGNLRYCKAWGSWLAWDGARWRPEHTDLAFDFARSLARAANPSGKSNIAKAAFSRGVETFARAARCFATESDQWDCDAFLLNTPGGVVDLRTGIMRPHDHTDYITKITCVTPRPGPKPVFDRFMRDITCGDNDLIAYHQRSLGAILSGALVLLC